MGGRFFIVLVNLLGAWDLTANMNLTHDKKTEVTVVRFLPKMVIYQFLVKWRKMARKLTKQSRKKSQNVFFAQKVFAQLRLSRNCVDGFAQKCILCTLRAKSARFLYTKCTKMCALCVVAERRRVLRRTLMPSGRQRRQNRAAILLL